MRLPFVAQAASDPSRVLVGEVKVSVKKGQVADRLRELRHRAQRCPALDGKLLEPTLWVLRPEEGAARTES